ncbi:hypothetical protein [Brachyspira sp. SAP_772]|nr:hypothetical protein [Brachyspira sp. SAP_772]
MQKPPIYSAKKIDCKRAYDLEREIILIGLWIILMLYIKQQIE